jgi:TolB-like protein/Flp pilus assembly protein TadD
MQPDVFVSHSSKDKATADAICQRLESEGITCWIAPRDIDVGSDWTERIIQAIDSCRVFVLVFSENANISEHVRREVVKAFSSGLAVIPFRVENTVPNGSLAYFLGTVHWLDAITPPLDKHLSALTERVKQLLADKERSAGNETRITAKTKIRPPASAWRRAGWVAGAFLVSAAIVIASWWLSQRPRSLATEIPVKSVAVLPFENISANKDDTYFADGVQDEILNNLAKIVQLKVISRTSVMQYRADTKRDLRQIANALGVANVLEGTVRRDGSHVRVSTKLIDARNDHTVWADSYDRDLIDIFAIQSQVAQTIASKLAATLSVEEKKHIEAKPTENLEAYDLYLQASEWIANAEIALFTANVEIALKRAINSLERAVRIDSKFTLAYCAAARAQDLLYVTSDPTPTRRALGDVAVDNALRLEPDLPEVHLAYADHLYRGYRDYERARVQLAIARRGLPNSSKAMMLEAYMDRRQGDFEKAVVGLNQAITLDPRNPIAIRELANSLYLMRQFAAAGQAYDRVIDLAPDQPMLKVERALYVSRQKTGNDNVFRSAIAALPASMTDDRDVLSYRLICALDDRDWQLAKQLLENMKGGDDDGYFSYAPVPVPVGCYSILLARLQGEQPDTSSSFGEAREQLNQKVQMSPGNAKLLSNLAVIDALLGKKQDAIGEAKHAIEMCPTSTDALAGPGIVMNLALVYAWTNELDLAFETLGPLTTTPNGVYYGELKLDPHWEPLRKDPRLGKLLAELAPKE